MAVTKIKPIKATLNKAIDYICNPEKTDEKLLVSSFGCSYETADIEFDFTLSQTYNKGNNLAHHLIQSFVPGEATFEQAHEIGKKLADEILGGKYEYVLSTHTDKGHIHNHIIFCAADFVNHRKYVSNKQSYNRIRSVSDKLCKEYSLDVLQPSKNKGKSYIEYTAEKNGTSWKVKLKVTMDKCIALSKTYEEFLEQMKAAGYEIKQGKYTSFRAVGQERFTRSKTLGEEYADERIKERIQGVKAPQRLPKQDTKTINLIIDIENHIKAQENAGYAQWAKINNLKQMAKTVNFLKENNLLQYADLQAKIKEVVATFDKTADTLKTVEKKLSEMGILMKNINTYRQLKPVYDEYQRASNKDKFRNTHERDIILFEAAAKVLGMNKQGAKLPFFKALKEDYDKLVIEKERLNTEYDKHREVVKQYDTLKANIDQFLKTSVRQELTEKKKEEVNI